MADTDKNILITPNKGSTTSDPKIEFTGGSNNPVTLTVLDDGTLSISGSSGQLFSVADSLTGTIFSVNDVSGVPSIEVDDTGVVRLAEFSGNVLIGTAVDNGNKVQVDGAVDITDSQLIIRNTSSGRNSTIGMDDNYNFWIKNTPLGNLYIGNNTTTYVQGHLNIGNSNISDVENIYVDNSILSTGDTDTYIQFHAADQWRVVTGGTERLEVNNTGVSVNNTVFYANAGIITPDISTTGGSFTGNNSSSAVYFNAQNTYFEKQSDLVPGIEYTQYMLTQTPGTPGYEGRGGIVSVAPNSGQVLSWDGSALTWVDQASGGGGGGLPFDSFDSLYFQNGTGNSGPGDVSFRHPTDQAAIQAIADALNAMSNGQTFTAEGDDFGSGSRWSVTVDPWYSGPPNYTVQNMGYWFTYNTSGFQYIMSATNLGPTTGAPGSITIN